MCLSWRFLLYTTRKKKKKGNYLRKKGQCAKVPFQWFWTSHCLRRKQQETIWPIHIWSLALAYTKKIQLNRFQNNVIEMFLLGCWFWVGFFFYFQKVERCQWDLVIPSLYCFSQQKYHSANSIISAILGCMMVMWGRKPEP